MPQTMYHRLGEAKTSLGLLFAAYLGSDNTVTSQSLLLPQALVSEAARQRGL